MSKFSNTIKLFDIYGSYFNLRINNEAKFKSMIGGLFSIITMAIFLFCILNFGKNFFHKLNPKISVTQSFLPDDAPFWLTGDAYEDKTIIISFSSQYQNVLIPIIYNKNGNNSTDIVINKCDEAGMSMLHSLLTNSPEEQAGYLYYCVKLNDFAIGSDSLSQGAFTPTFSITMQECGQLDPAISNAQNITCNYDYLLNNTIDSFTAVVYFEKFGFIPENLMPFTTRLTAYQFLFVNTSMAQVNIPLILNTLQDDRGIISAETNSYSVLNVDTFTQTNYKYDSTIPLAYLNFYLSEQNHTYLRSYEKLQDLLAAIGGFMKIIFTALNVLNFIIRSYLIDMHIIDTLFRKEEAESEFYQAMQGNISVDTIKSKNKINNFLGDINSTVKESKLKIVNKNGKAYNTTDKSETEKKEDSCCKRTVSYFSAVFHNIFNKKFSNETRKGEKMEVLRNKLVVADRIRDFNYIAEKMNELDVMKGMMLNEHQSLCLKFLKKPSYVEVSDISKTFSTMANSNEENIEIVCNYFIRLLNEDPLSGYDEFLFKNLDDRVRDRILMKLST